MDRKDRSHAAIHIEVRGPVQRIEENAQGTSSLNLQGILHLFGSDQRNQAPFPEGFHQNLVGAEVHFLDGLALDVRAPGRAQHTGQPREPQLLGYPGSACRGRREDSGQILGDGRSSQKVLERWKQGSAHASPSNTPSCWTAAPKDSS